MTIFCTDPFIHGIREVRGHLRQDSFGLFRLFVFREFPFFLDHLGIVHGNVGVFAFGPIEPDRPTRENGLKLNYASIKTIPATLLEQKKTESEYLTVSNPALTATDLVQFEKRIGGLNRAATVLNELIEVITPADFNQDLLEYVPATAMQRLGYFLEFETGEVLSPMVYSEQEWFSKYKVTPFYSTVMREGKLL